MRGAKINEVKWQKLTTMDEGPVTFYCEWKLWDQNKTLLSKRALVPSDQKWNGINIEQCKNYTCWLVLVYLPNHVFFHKHLQNHILHNFSLNLSLNFSPNLSLKFSPNFSPNFSQTFPQTFPWTFPQTNGLASSLSPHSKC